ncbi:hypothetical protein ES288_A09G071800v1 [Gossypium darwinii]|uniref:Uncharacterized protein n=1 Tax=Gossypium darwinii TaxID=34276 RepID=A0A5D2F809_GOSDA|nr:hypothetical protein ES288_A09G071800v1 [Gossypium darwinii]
MSGKLQFSSCKQILLALLLFVTGMMSNQKYKDQQFWSQLKEDRLSVQLAIKFFFEARPPGIYKPDDIDALYAFYHERRPESLVCPPTPEWKRSSDLYLNGEATGDDDDDDDDGAPTALLVRGHAQFPGSHPVSLNRSFICLVLFFFLSSSLFWFLILHFVEISALSLRTVVGL